MIESLVIKLTCKYCAYLSYYKISFVLLLNKFEDRQE